MAGSGSIAGTTAPLPSTGAAKNRLYVLELRKMRPAVPATTIERAVLLAGVQAARPSQAA